MAAANLGAVAFVDLPAWRALYGEAGTVARFREVLAQHLRGAHGHAPGERQRTQDDSRHSCAR